MEKIYKYKNAIVYILNPNTYNREGLKKATEEFLKKVLKGEKN